ncbi:unnamed protein product [Eruca vesicaria subsp. sativa]|uniref:Uncharacterized protein n=1 Tax=Eruca vesicaria subsp. sativa TaxID=29727 RepID=A0ABC8JRL2_ERUVS|nr:unnamed protein product [Eruca vesicaria subsp. sativa]CAH8337488.1 unnamed protein product [Eruca vesicaria subsp. sativa]
MGEIKARRMILLSIIFLFFFFSETIFVCSANEHGSRNLAVVMKQRVRNRGSPNSNTTSAASTMMLPSSFHVGAASSFLLALLFIVSVCDSVRAEKAAECDYGGDEDDESDEHDLDESTVSKLLALSSGSFATSGVHGGIAANDGGGTATHC